MEYARLDYAEPRMSAGAEKALDIALTHAAQGRRVFPFRLTRATADAHADKRPLVKWKEAATTDDATIRAWAKKWPTAKYGWVLDEGDVVVDIDDLAAFLEADLDLPETATQTTPSGGSHWLYRGSGVRQTVKEIPGIDTRVGGKGWVGLYSSSSFSGPVADAPEWLFTKKASSSRKALTPDDPLTTRAELLELTGRWRWAGMEEEEILAGLLARYGDGRITESDSSRPWSKQDFEFIAKEMGAKPKGEPTPIPQVRGGRKNASKKEMTAFTASSILDLDLPELQWGIPDILPEGTTLIVSPPKIGKSALVMQIAVALRAKGILFERHVPKKRPVLYLALEDGERRIQSRLRSNLSGLTSTGKDLMDGFEIVLDAPTIGHGLEETLTSYYDDFPDGAVFIDTLQHVRPEHKSGRGAYEMDVADLRTLRELVRNRPGAILGIVHHTNKPNDAGDFVAAVSGTHGLAGTADTVLRVVRKRHEATGILEVTGRDVPDLELPVIFDDMRWDIDPNPRPLPGESDIQNEIFLWLKEHGPARPIDVWRGLLAANVKAGTKTNVQNRMGTMAEKGRIRLERTGGWYEVVEMAHSDA